MKIVNSVHVGGCGFESRPPRKCRNSKPLSKERGFEFRAADGTRKTEPLSRPCEMASRGREHLGFCERSDTKDLVIRDRVCIRKDSKTWVMFRPRNHQGVPST